jgi:hypothetical protein
MNLRKTIKAIPFAPSAYALLRLLRGRKARFSADYHQNSGVGSTLEATFPIIEALPKVVNSYSIGSILDIPCGDFLWMRQIDLSSVNYIGADIIDTLIISHQRNFGSSRKEFRTLDLVKDDLPKVDLILCRDCLVHCSERLVKKALRNIQRSGSQYLFSTTFSGHATNTDIVTGNWRPLNLCAPPFNLPPPVYLLNERNESPFEDKSLGLWRIQDLPAFS